MNILNKDEKRILSFNNLGLLFLIIFFCYEMSIIYKNVFILSDSDISSNMIYGKLLLEKKSILLNDWYYSTFVDILNIDKVFSFFFLFSNNWKIVHFAEIVSVNILLIVSFVYSCIKLKIKYTFWLCFLFIGSLSFDGYRYLIYFNIYTIYLIFSFLSIGLTVDIINSSDSISKKIKEILLFVLTASACTSGFRNVVTLYCPIVGSMILILICNFFFKKDLVLSKQIYKSIIIILLGSIIGYLANSFVIVPYSNFSNYSLGLTLEPMRDFTNLFKKVLFEGWVNLFGVNDFSFKSITCFVILFFTIIGSVKILFNKSNFCEEKFVVLTFIISASITSATFFISTTEFTVRYLLQPFSICALIIGIYLNKINNNILKYGFCLLLAINSCILGIKYLNIDIANSNNYEIEDISDILINEGITEGYASYWNANLLTEVSNGEIDVWSYWLESYLVGIKEDISEGKLKSDEISHKYLNEWLQKYDHFEVYPENTFFVIINNQYLDIMNNYSDKYLKYSGQYRSLYIFTSIDEMFEYIKN